MGSLRFLLPFLRRYRAEAAYSLLLLVALVALDLAVPRLIQRMIDRGIHASDRRVVVETAVIMLAISALSFAAAIGNNAFSVRAGEGVARDLRDALFSKIQTFSYANLDEQRTGQLLVVLSSDVNAIKSLVQISLRIGTRAPLMMLGSAILMFETSPTLVTALLPVFLGAGVSLGFFVVKTEPMVLALQARLDALNGVLQESISGIRLVKSLVREPFEDQRFGGVNEQAAMQATRVMAFTASMMPALTFCLNVGTVVVIWFGGMRAVDGRMTLGQVVAFANYLATSMVPLVMTAMLAHVWASGLASGRRITGIFETVPAVVDAAHPVTIEPGAPQISFEGVGFSYVDDCDEPVLRDVDLKVRPGQTIAFLGPTGAGKSTLVQLIPRFYDASHGVVRLGVHDVRSVRQDDLRGRIAIVPQDSLLFSGTIRENIRYGRPSATDEEVQRAARLAEAHEFIEQLPSRYDSIVAPRGANLSGGQRQRLAIARALLLEPDVLILDDSTSAVDVETETRIQDAVRSLARVSVTVVVAQRVSTVLRADEICLLDRGRIVAQGKHETLLRTSPLYQEIYESQLGAGSARVRSSGRENT